MLTYGSERDVEVTSYNIIGVFLCLGAILFLIAATIVLSLISLYMPNHGEEGYGDRKYKYRIFKKILFKKKTKILEYQIKTFLIKALYQNSSYTFVNAPVADSIEMSNLVIIESILLGFLSKILSI